MSNYNKVECEIDEKRERSRVVLVTQTIFDHFKSFALQIFTLGLVKKDFAKRVTVLEVKGDVELTKIFNNPENTKAIMTDCIVPTIKNILIPVNTETMRARIEVFIFSKSSDKLPTILPSDLIESSNSKPSLDVSTTRDINLVTSHDSYARLIPIVINTYNAHKKFIKKVMLAINSVYYLPDVLAKRAVSKWFSREVYQDIVSEYNLKMQYYSDKDVDAICTKHCENFDEFKKNLEDIGKFLERLKPWYTGL